MNAPFPPGLARRSAPRRQRIAVVGSGISGLSAAWLLQHAHDVVLFEGDVRAGGHSNTVETHDAAGRPVPVDTGFIVFNEASYPNLSALLRHLGVQTRATEMSFAVSLDGGALEYSGTGLAGLFAQSGNLVRPRFWSMLRDLVRFYREAPKDAAACDLLPLDDYLSSRGYGRAFREDHLYPMAAAIWSTPASAIGRYPVAAFVRFCENHNLLSLGARPAWRTVAGGSREYVRRMLAPLGQGLRLACPVIAVVRNGRDLRVVTVDGADLGGFDHVVLATHADQALRLLPDASADERRLLGAVRYQRNRAVLHDDPALMPRRRAVWSSWNYLADRRAGAGAERSLCVSYWMNRLQGQSPAMPLFVTLNPPADPPADRILRVEHYEHPVFDVAAMRAQRELWSLQGQRGTWFCGAYFGAGFHEDGLQAGLAVAEAIGGVRRPWSVAAESGRIVLPARPGQAARTAAEALP